LALPLGSRSLKLPTPAGEGHGGRGAGARQDEGRWPCPGAPVTMGRPLAVGTGSAKAPVVGGHQVRAAPVGPARDCTVVPSET